MPRPKNEPTSSMRRALRYSRELCIHDYISPNHISNGDMYRSMHLAAWHTDEAKSPYTIVNRPLCEGVSPETIQFDDENAPICAACETIAEHALDPKRTMAFNGEVGAVRRLKEP